MTAAEHLRRRGRRRRPRGNGCTLLTSPDVLLLQITDSKGRATQNIPVPPGAVGSFYAQAGILDMTAAGGLTVSNAVSPSAN